MTTTTRPLIPIAATGRRRRPIAVVAAVLALLVVWVVAVPVFGADLTVQAGGDAARVICALFLSLVGPLTSATTSSASVVLLAMHINVAAVLILLMLARSGARHA